MSTRVRRVERVVEQSEWASSCDGPGCSEQHEHPYAPVIGDDLLLRPAPRPEGWFMLSRNGSSEESLTFHALPCLASYTADAMIRACDE